MFLIACLFIAFFAATLRVYKLVFTNKHFNEPVEMESNASPAVGYFLTKEINAFNFINKFKLRFFFSSFCVVLVLLFNISANVSIWPNIKGLSSENKQHSIAFRSLRGSNCISEFAALKPVLDAAATNDYAVDDIISILGKPDAIVNNGNTLQYNLFPSNAGCIGLVECSNGKIVKCSIVNCN